MNDKNLPDTKKKLIKTGTFLKCHCPHCGRYLIEDNKLILEIENPEKERGEIILSPYLNFYDTSSSVQLPEWKEINDLFCPYCHESVKDSNKVCGTCGAAAARIHVEAEGEKFDFYFCLRKGCPWHDISEEAKRKIVIEATGFHKPDDHELFIKTGTKLQCFCPNCEESLLDNDHLILHVKDRNGKLGVLKLSPYLNVFTNECSIYLGDKEEVQDMICPKCNKSLWKDDKKCQICGAKAAMLKVRVNVLELDFYICMRKDCHWHGISTEDRQRILLDDSMEW